MRANQFLPACVTLLLTVAASVAGAQVRLCSTVPAVERAFARAVGACTDAAPIVDVAPQGAGIALPSVVGAGFDEAKVRLSRFSVRRSYRASSEPGGTVLEQQPSSQARLPAGAIVRLVLSDGSLRPAPRVAPSEVDEPPGARAASPDQRPQSAAVPGENRTGVVDQSPIPRSVAPPNDGQSDTVGRSEVERVPMPNVLGMTVRDAQARLSRFRVERRERSSSAASGRVVEQSPKPDSRVAPGQPIVLVVSSGPARVIASPRVTAAAAPAVTEFFELPNVVDRSFESASTALAEFKVERIEMPSAAPSGQVISQDPAPGAQLRAGSAVIVRVSNGSLATPAGATTAGLPAPLPAATQPPVAVQPPVVAASTPEVASPTSPVPSTATAPPPDAASATAPSTASAPSATAPSATAPLTDVASPTSTVPSAAAAPPPQTAQNEALPGALTGNTALALGAAALAFLLGAFLLRRRAPRSEPATAVEPTFDVDAAQTVPSISEAPVSEVKFAARLEEVETTITFAPTADVDEEEAIEHTGDVHG